MGLVSNREVQKVAYLSSLFVFFFCFCLFAWTEDDFMGASALGEKQGKAFYVASPRCRYAGKWSRGRKGLMKYVQ